MRKTALFTTSFALLALWCPSALASPAVALDVSAETSIDEVIDSAPPFHGNGTEGALAPPPYIVNCATFPNVCENWCYYVFCRQGGRDKNAAAWTVTVNRSAALRGKSECGRISPNKCSVKAGVWPPNPVPNQDCDEQPKNTNDEGGANAATRCMDRSENRGEGSTWSQYINNGGPGRIPDGTKIKVELTSPGGPLCKSYITAGTTRCPAPVLPMSPGAAADPVRQQ